MINGAHVVVYTRDAEADRAFFRDILGFASVDAGHGWLIFGLPAAELAFHPADVNDQHELYLMCEDLKAEMAALRTKGVECAEVVEARWGSITTIRLPGGGEIGLYQPKHPRPRLAAEHPHSASLPRPRARRDELSRLYSPCSCNTDVRERSL